MQNQNGGSGLKKVLGLAVIAFGVTLAVIIGKRMSTDAMAVVVGVACGVLASIPTSLLILAVTHRQSRSEDRYRPPQQQTPPVVIVQGGRAEQPGVPLLSKPSPYRSSEPRQFKLVGQPEEEVWP